jgi:hypothetical protein
MLRRLAAAGVVGIALLAAGCGDDGRAKAVSQYIDDVNAVQLDLRVPLARVAASTRAVQSGPKLEEQRRKLEQAVKTLRKLEQRLDALEPPPDAQRLDSLLRLAVHADTELAEELVLVAVYARDSKAPLADAAAAQTRVRAALKAARKPAAQAVALDDLARSQDGVAKQLGRLHPAPTLAPQHETSIRMFERIAESARKVAVALRRGKDPAKPLHELQVATASASTIAAQRARIAAVRAYNKRVIRARRLLTDAQRERTRLQRTL